MQKIRNERKRNYKRNSSFASSTYKKRTSRLNKRMIQKKIQKGKKRIFFNILRNKTFQHVLSTLKNSFKSKPSILVLKNLENYSHKLYLKVKSLKQYIYNYGKMGTYNSAPVFVLTT